MRVSVVSMLHHEILVNLYLYDTFPASFVLQYRCKSNWLRNFCPLSGFVSMYTSLCPFSTTHCCWQCCPRRLPGNHIGWFISKTDFIRMNWIYWLLLVRIIHKLTSRQAKITLLRLQIVDSRNFHAFDVVYLILASWR